jgi:hypothetical protein
VAPTNEERS